MKLATCSYYRYETDMGLPVRVSLGLPRWIPESKGWPSLWAATPRWSYWDAAPDEFDRKFVAQLDRYTVPGIRALLDQIATAHGAETLVLCCFERKIAGPQSCHRRLLANWWTDHTHERVPELDPAPPEEET